MMRLQCNPPKSYPSPRSSSSRSARSANWSTFSRTGVHGRPTLATAEKGKTLLDAAVDEIAGYVRELQGRPLPERREPREQP